VDIYCELTGELEEKTKEFLHPNPASRAKMSAVKGIGKLSGQAKASTYPQPEGVLGECMVSYGKRLGEEDCMYAQALVETGESMKQIADIKYNLDDNMKMNFLEPMHMLAQKDLKEVMHHRKKLQGRRLDFDCKKRKKDKTAGSHVTDEEIKLAEDKFAESWHLAQMGMHNLLENDVEQVSQLATFAENLVEYHRQCGEILDALVGTLHDKKNDAAMETKREYVPKTLSDLGVMDTLNGGLPSNISATTPQRSPYGSHASSPVHTPTHTPQFPGASPLPSPCNPSGPASGGQSWDPLFPPGGPPRSANASPLPSPMKSPARTPSMTQPSGTALYDFEPENPGELGFNEGDTIILTQQIDENWYEGRCNGKAGLFPCSYVQVTNPLPN